MKHRLLYIFILAMMSILLSCSKSSLEQEGGLLSETPLAFSPTAGWPEIANGSAAGAGDGSGNGIGTGTGAGSGTKALITSASELQQYGISLFATASKDANTYVVFNNDLLKYSNSAWNYDITKYWITGAVYRFAAFAPYAKTGEKTSKTISNGTVAVTGTDSEPSITITDYITGRPGDKTFDARSEDLVFAEVVRDNTDNNDYSTVPLNFSHLLSCVSFYVRNATNQDIESIDNIKLGGIEYKCNINIGLQGTSIVNTPLQNSEDSSPYFTGDDRPTTAESPPFLPKGMAENEFKPLFDCTSLTLLPQNISGKEIEISFTTHHTEKDDQNKDVEIEVNYSGNLGTIEGITRWQPGKKYRYNITISSQEIIFQVAEVPWIKHEVEL